MEMTKIFCENVMAICSERKIKIGKLEDEMGVSRGYIRQVLNHQREIGISKVVLAAKYLNVSIDSLLEKDGWKKQIRQTIIQHIARTRFPI